MLLSALIVGGNIPFARFFSRSSAGVARETNWFGGAVDFASSSMRHSSWSEYLPHLSAAKQRCQMIADLHEGAY